MNELQLVNIVFSELQKATTFKDLTDLMERHPTIQKNIPNQQRYPALAFSLNSEDIELLMKKNELTDDNCIQPPNENNTALEKLLYSVLWKNGDLGKEARLIEGILSEDDRTPDGNSIVFHQFGKKLSDSSEPIVDQHTLRAFEVYTSGKEDVQKLMSVLKKEIYNKKDWGLALKYKEWLKGNIDKNLQTKEGMHLVDQVLFGLGKAIKKKTKS